jgi:Domain of unknown function (DUF4157)
VQLSQDLSAHAFTHGSDVYFNSGKFAPDTEGGRHLLAHELTHTVQQGSGVQRKIQRIFTDEQLSARADRESAPPVTAPRATQMAASGCDATKSKTAKQAQIKPFLIADNAGANPTTLPNLIGADRIWEQCCIHLQVMDVTTINNQSFLDLNVGTGNASADELSLATNKVNGAINVFIVKNFVNGGTTSKNHSGGGRTFGLGTNEPVSILVEGAHTSVVAHEIGHGLRGNTSHEAATVMEGSNGYNIPNPSAVSATVCSTSRNWGGLTNVSTEDQNCCMII